MKKYLFLCLSLCLLFSGCSSPKEEPSPTQMTTMSTTAKTNDIKSEVTQKIDEITSTIK